MRSQIDIIAGNGETTNGVSAIADEGMRSGDQELASASHTGAFIQVAITSEEKAVGFDLEGGGRAEVEGANRQGSWFHFAAIVVGFGVEKSI